VEGKGLDVSTFCGIRWAAIIRAFAGARYRLLGAAVAQPHTRDEYKAANT
jgi:hypothetical protein